MPTSTIVIGTGISAVAYMATARREILGITDVLGGRDLWHSVHGGHAMGQPRVLLTGNVLGGPIENRGHASPHEEGFMRAGDFAALLDWHIVQSSRLRLPGAFVTRVQRGRGWGYEVHFVLEHAGRRMPLIGYAENVVVAVGAGPARPLTAGADGRLEVPVADMDGQVIGGTEFMSPEWRMPGGRETRDAAVVVYGGSATAAWVVEQAQARGMRVVRWFTRQGRAGDDSDWNPDVRFREAFPAGDRNERVEAELREVRCVRRLLAVDRVPGAPPYVKLTLVDSEGDEELVPCDVFIYALGSQHTATAGVRAMLADDLQDDLIAYYDRNFAISSGQALLAMGTEDRSLMIVGSAMSSAAGFDRDRITVADPERALQTVASYREIASTLPAAARPTEGIAMVLASIEALNDFVPARPRAGGRVGAYVTPEIVGAQATGPGQVAQGSHNRGAGLTTFHAIDFDWNLNFNLANRTQLALYFAAETDLHPFVATLAVALIVKLRAHPEHTFGLNGNHLRVITAAAFESWARTTREYPNFENERLASDRAHGADRYLEICVAHLTTDPEWLGFWRRVGVLG